MACFRELFNQHEGLFRNKIVMAIGDNSGILSMMAIKAGAKHLYLIGQNTSDHLVK